MPLLFGGSWPSAPIIIPITAAVVVGVAIVLLVFHLIRKLASCPHHQAKYPIHDQDPSKMKSVLPTSPYTIDPSSSASSNSIYFVKGSGPGASGLLYPALAASAPSRTPSTGRAHPDDSFDRSGSPQVSYSLDQVDSALEPDIVMVETHQTSSSRPLTQEEAHALLPRSSSALTGSSSSPMPYEVEGVERTTFRQEVSYQRSERQEFINFNNGSSEPHYESDV